MNKHFLFAAAILSAVCSQSAFARESNERNGRYIDNRQDKELGKLKAEKSDPALSPATAQAVKDQSVTEKTISNSGEDSKRNPAQSPTKNPALDGNNVKILGK